jgi:ribosomal protein S18 acetylase RimI-like enzyme
VSERVTVAPVIRPGRPEEASRLVELWRAAGATPSRTDSPAEVRRLLAAPESVVLVAERDGRLVGTVVGGWDGWRGNIYRLVVSPEERRQGLARALVVELAQRLRTRGARRITALVEREHGPAMAFWDSLRDIGCARDPRMMRFVL